MDRGRKKLIAFVQKIQKHNEKTLSREVDKIVNLKTGRFGFKTVDLSKISVMADSKYEIIIHENTHNYPQTTEHLLNIMNDLQDQHPFLDLHLAKGNEAQKVIIRVFWSDYIKATLPTMSRPVELPELGAEAPIKSTSEQNAEKVRAGLDKILKEASSRTTEQYSDGKITLCPNTMLVAATRRAFGELRRELQAQYPYVELYRIEKDKVLIRVWWGLYFEYLEATGQDIPAPPDKGGEGRPRRGKKLKNAAKAMVAGAIQHSNGGYTPV